MLQHQNYLFNMVLVYRYTIQIVIEEALWTIRILIKQYEVSLNRMLNDNMH